ncbi:MAG: HAMP domain-containing histidine kinase [Clostridiales bacterium]|nr:HAMP domain-containing histidine kinase [Clostridiales bacterium]
MFRNRELRQLALILSLITIAAAILGFTIDTKAGILVLAFAAAFGVTFFVFTGARYRSIARISEEIDLVLHNADHLYIGEADEGELSILQSEIKKMTLRIREKNDALKREKEHLADSLADIAHQLRTPLTAANLILSLLENSDDENQRKELIRETEGLFAQMEWLLNSLLKLSRLDAGIVTFQSVQTDVKELINTSLRPLLISMELHNIDLHIDAPENVRISGDSSWLSEAVQNILKNCIESTGDNGRIEILCQDTPLFTEITFHDNGKGFEKDDLPHIFDRFYRGKNEGASGYGIGLALCKTIITRQGGTVTAKNHPHGGAVFAIRFPK